MIRGDPAIDHLWVNLSELPYFRALLRAVEARFYEEIELEQPILDLGCGDGHFVSTAFSERLDIGLDPWTGPVREAARRGSYSHVLQGSGYHLPFQSGVFASVISNSVLEHIPDLDRTLAEVNRVLQPNGRFVFCVPNHQFLASLEISSALDRMGMKYLGDRYRIFFNFISRHHHCDSPEVWRERLQRLGFEIDSWWHYFPPDALHTLEWGHYFGLPALMVHFITRRWILLSTRWNLSLTQRIVSRHYEDDPKSPQGVYTFYITHKVA